MDTDHFRNRRRNGGLVLAAVGITLAGLTATMAPAVAAPSAAPAAAQAALPQHQTPGHGRSGDKPRVILTNDGEVDDMDSFIRYLYYANEFKTEGIVLTSSTFHYAGNGSDIDPYRWTGTTWINDYIDKYAKIYPNLRKHDSGYPSPSYLRSIYKVGNITNVGEMDQVTDGSQLIMKRILDPNPDSLYVLAWGGTNTFARALKSIQEKYQGEPDWAALQKKISAKVVVYNILTQDDTLANYIKPNWPHVKIIDNTGAFWGFAYAWKFVVPTTLQTTLKGAWLGENIVNNHGDLADEYRTMRDGKPTPGDDENNRWDPNANAGFDVYDFLSEGDSPSFMYLLDFNGLRSAEDPTWGGWGGRFAANASGWADTADKSPYSTCGGSFVDPCKSYAQLRWINEFQNDFAARVDWGTTRNYKDGNHVPSVKVRQGLNLTRRAGSTVQLCVKAVDPDRDKVAVSARQYEEADTYPGTVSITDSRRGGYRFTVPTDAIAGQTIHVIIQATDDGTPALTRYARVVVTVK